MTESVWSLTFTLSPTFRVAVLISFLPLAVLPSSASLSKRAACCSCNPRRLPSSRAERRLCMAWSISPYIVGTVPSPAW